MSRQRRSLIAVVRSTLAAVLVLLIAGLGVPARADASGIPGSVDELLKIYGIEDEPADYVVVVDTSASMMMGSPIYPDVQKVYAAFTESIKDGDHLAVVTFDTSAVVRFNATLDAANRGAAAAALPHNAQGAGTDIGGGLDAALDRLARPDGGPVQTLIFLTDGRIDAPRSPYGTRGTPAWQELRARADRLGAGRSVAVYGAGLGGGVTDIESLKDVFPRAKVVSLPNDQLPAFFAEAVERARVERLRIPITQELTRNSIQAVATPETLADTTTLHLRFDSTFPHLGATVNVRDVSVTTPAGEEFRSTLVGGPRSVTIGPGRSSDPIDLLVQVPGLYHQVRLGQVPEARDFVVNVQADLEAEPAAIIASELGIEAKPQLAGADVTTATRMHGIAWWMVGAALVALVLLGTLVRWVVLRWFATPRLRGGVQLPDGTIHPFRGKEHKLPGRGIEFDGSGSSVIAFTKPGAYESWFNIRRPRIYVRGDEGLASARIVDTEYPLDGGEQRLHNLDEIVIGQTQIIFLRNVTKG